MEYRSDEIKAGCFVILSIVLLIAFLVVVSGLDLFKTTKDYLASFRYTGGIEAGSLVRYGGFKVGTVKKVQISDADNSSIEFVLELENKVPVKKDSKAFITSIGIMGENYIEITTGSNNSELMPAGSMLNCEEVTPLMMLTKTVDQLTEQLSVTIDRVNQLLNSENQEQISGILANLNKLVQDNQQTVGSLMENLNGILTSVNSMGTRVDTLLLENQESIARSIQQLEATLEQTQGTIGEFKLTMENINHMLASQNGNYNEIMDNLSNTSHNLDEFTRSIKEKPWSLIRKSAPKEREIK